MSEPKSVAAAIMAVETVVRESWDRLKEDATLLLGFLLELLGKVGENDTPTSDSRMRFAQKLNEVILEQAGEYRQGKADIASVALLRLIDEHGDEVFTIFDRKMVSGFEKMIRGYRTMLRGKNSSVTLAQLKYLGTFPPELLTLQEPEDEKIKASSPSETKLARLMRLR